MIRYAIYDIIHLYRGIKLQRVISPNIYALIQAEIHQIFIQYKYVN